MLGYIAIDQYGTTYQIGNNPPRKWLLNFFGATKADKMFVEKKDGTTKHIGYVIQKLWISVFKICDWKENEKN